MLRQLAREETLVPPNFRTIQAEAVRVTSVFLGQWAESRDGPVQGRADPDTPAARAQTRGPRGRAQVWCARRASSYWLLPPRARLQSSSSKSRRAFSSFLSAS